MASTTASAGSQLNQGTKCGEPYEALYDSTIRLTAWLEKNNDAGYDTFDGLDSRFLRPLTFESKFLRQVLQQSVRRFPLNLRPLLGVPKSRSTKGMADQRGPYNRRHSLRQVKGSGLVIEVVAPACAAISLRLVIDEPLKDKVRPIFPNLIVSQSVETNEPAREKPHALR